MEPMARIHLANYSTTCSNNGSNRNSLNFNTTNKSITLLNISNRLEDTAGERSPCKLHLPDWLNIWWILLIVCILVIMCTLLLIVNHMKRLRQRQTSQWNPLNGTPDFYSEQYLDRSHIMVY